MERDIHHSLKIISTKLLWFNPLMSTLQHQCNENISDKAEFCHYSRGIVNLINSIYVISFHPSSFQITIIVEKQQDKPWKGRDFSLVLLSAIILVSAGDMKQYLQPIQRALVSQEGTSGGDTRTCVLQEESRTSTSVCSVVWEKAAGGLRPTKWTHVDSLSSSF